jgi:hypothetical protein
MAFLIVFIIQLNIIITYRVREKHFKKLLGRPIEHIPSSDELMSLWHEKAKFRVLTELIFIKFFNFIARLDLSKEIVRLSDKKLKILRDTDVIKPETYFKIMIDRHADE